MVFKNKSIFTLLVATLTTLSTVQAADMFRAIAQRNIRQVRSVLKNRPDLAVLNNEGQTILHAAVLSEKDNIVRTILKTDINVNEIDMHGKTALDYAVEYGYSKIIISLVKHQAQVTSWENAESVAKIVYKQRILFYVKLLFKLAILLPISMYFIGHCLGIAILDAIGYGAGICATSGVAQLVFGCTNALAISLIIPWYVGVPFGFAWGAALVNLGAKIEFAIAFVGLSAIYPGLLAIAIAVIRRPKPAKYLMKQYA